MLHKCVNGVAANRLQEFLYQAILRNEIELDKGGSALHRTKYMILRMSMQRSMNRACILICSTLCVIQAINKQAKYQNKCWQSRCTRNIQKRPDRNINKYILDK